MQSDPSRIWIRVAVSISYPNNHYRNMIYKFSTEFMSSEKNFILLIYILVSQLKQFSWIMTDIRYSSSKENVGKFR